MDPADFDGDGEFDVIDIDIIEDITREEKRGSGRTPPNGNGSPGCCVILFFLGATGFFMKIFLLKMAKIPII